jgi:hypothetical protein
MATEIILRRSKANAGLWAASAPDAETMDTLAEGVDYRAVLTRVQGRSVQHNRLLFALIKIAGENCDEELTTRAILDVLKLKTGHVQVSKLPSGEIMMTPSSISFEKMDQDEFNKWFPRAIDVIARDFLNGADPLALTREVHARAGAPSPQQRAA